MGEMIRFKRPDGKEVEGYLAVPDSAADHAPGVVVIQEWWGLNSQIKGVADKMAEQGYRALVPDLFRGKLGLDASEAGHLMNGLDFGDAAGQDIAGAVSHLKSTGSAKVGVTGFCMGGALTLLASVLVPKMDAGVAWYGYPPLEFIDASRITAPLMAHWAIEDTAFPIDKVATLEQKLDAANVPYEFHRYQAKHGFANEEANAKGLDMLQYDPVHAEQAWKRTFAFFASHLR